MHYQNSAGRIYITGLNRAVSNPQRAHLYDGSFGDPGKGMCRHAWNRDEGSGYSIFRGNLGPKGICKTCVRRAERGEDGVDPIEHFTDED